MNSKTNWSAKRAKAKGEPMPKEWLADMRRIHSKNRCAGCDAAIDGDPPGRTVNGDPVCAKCCEVAL